MEASSTFPQRGERDRALRDSNARAQLESLSAVHRTYFSVVCSLFAKRKRYAELGLDSAEDKPRQLRDPNPALGAKESKPEPRRDF